MKYPLANYIIWLLLFGITTFLYLNFIFNEHNIGLRMFFGFIYIMFSFCLVLILFSSLEAELYEKDKQTCHGMEKKK